MIGFVKTDNNRVYHILNKKLRRGKPQLNEIINLFFGTEPYAPRTLTRFFIVFAFDASIFTSLLRHDVPFDSPRVHQKTTATAVVFVYGGGGVRAFK